MNLSLTKEEYHDTMMLYLVHIARENKGILAEGDVIVYSVEFDNFLRHILSRPLGNLRTAYMRENSKVKLSFKRMVKEMEDKDQVRLIV